MSFIRFLSSAALRHVPVALGLALAGAGTGVEPHPKDEHVLGFDAFTFALVQPVQQPVHRLNFIHFKGPALELSHLQREFPLLARVDAPHIVPAELMRLAKTYRQAVRLCLQIARHRRPGLRITDIALACGLTRQHVTDYFHEDDKPHRRDLPSEDVQAVEDYLGNTAISQWHAARAQFTVLEVLQAQGRAA